MKFIVLFLVGFIVYGCGASSVKQPASSLTDTTASSKNEIVNKEPEYKWEYSEEPDEMGDNPMKFASVEANEKLDFAFPYQGGSTVNLFLRNKRGKVDVILQISKGQFLGGINGGAMLVKFDDQKPIKYTYSEPADGSTTSAFIDGSAGFVSKLKKAKRVIIETQFYQEGPRSMSFMVGGLKWK